MPRARLAVLTSLLALALSACGGDGDGDGGSPAPAPRAATTQPDTQPGEPERTTPVPPEVRRLLPPDSVPREGTEEADDAEVGVVERWAATLRSGDVRGAARFWAVPSVAQNGTPLLRMRTAADVLAFNGGLTCGAVVSDARGAGDFLVVDFVLTTRKGGDPGCAASRGAPARVALRVVDGRIAAWYRLPGDEQGAPEPLAPSEIT